MVPPPTAMRHFTPREFQVLFSDIDTDADGVVTETDLKLWNTVVMAGLTEKSLTTAWKACLATSGLRGSMARSSMGRASEASLESGVGVPQKDNVAVDSAVEATRASLASEYDLRDSVSGLTVGKTTSGTRDKDMDTAPLFFLSREYNADVNADVNTSASAKASARTSARGNTKPVPGALATTRARRGDTFGFAGMRDETEDEDDMIDERALFDALQAQPLFQAKLAALTAVFAAIKHPDSASGSSPPSRGPRRRVGERWRAAQSQETMARLRAGLEVHLIERFERYYRRRAVEYHAGDKVKDSVASQVLSAYAE